MQVMFSFVPFFKIITITIIIIIIIIRWLWDLVVEVALLWKVGFCGGRKTRGPGEQICVARTKTNNKLNPHVTPGLENKPGPQCWESSTLSTAPSRLLQKEIEFWINCLRYNCYYICATDIDECTHGIHECLNESANCLNTVGSYNCVCKDGYQGDGKTICTPEGK